MDRGNAILRYQNTDPVAVQFGHLGLEYPSSLQSHERTIACPLTDVFFELQQPCRGAGYLLLELCFRQYEPGYWEVIEAVFNDSERDANQRGSISRRCTNGGAVPHRMDHCRFQARSMVRTMI